MREPKGLKIHYFSREQPKIEYLEHSRAAHGEKTKFINTKWTIRKKAFCSVSRLNILRIRMKHQEYKPKRKQKLNAKYLS